MKLYLNNFSISVDLFSEDVVDIAIDGDSIYFIHSDSTITTFTNGKIESYRFGTSSSFLNNFNFKDLFDIPLMRKDFFDGLQKKDEKKLVSEELPKRSRRKKS